MKKCRKFKKAWISYLYGELEREDRKQLEAHVQACPQCQQELKGFESVLEKADRVRADMQKAMDSVDWEALPAKIAENTFRKKAKAPWYRLHPHMRPVYAALFVGVILGVTVTLVFVRVPQVWRTGEVAFHVPQDVLEGMDVEVARRETLDYLEKSQNLLLDFIQLSPAEYDEYLQNELASGQVRSLLSKKKYINQQLDTYQMAKAKAICDQIEFLFLELTQISPTLSEAELNKVQELIKERKLLLKIRLLKKELEQSEV